MNATLVLDFLQTHWNWMLLGFLFSLVFSGLCFALACFLLIRLPHSYFSVPPNRACVRSPGFIERTRAALKNIFGGLIAAIGIVLAMPGVPGPGILIALLGLMLMDFRAKRRIEWLLVSSPGVFTGINQLRRRYGRAPFSRRTSLS